MKTGKTKMHDALIDRLSMSLPDELRRLRQFLLWRSEPGPAGKKPRKVPYYIKGNRRNGIQGSSADRAQLSAFSEAMEALESGDYTGLGIAMLAEANLIGIDLDGCVTDGKIKPELAPLVEKTYAELSPSGQGIRAFFLGNYADRKHLGAGVEIFHAKGFLTLTGDRLNANGIMPLPGSVKVSLDAFFAIQKTGTSRAERLENVEKSDPVYQQLLELQMVTQNFGSGKIGIRCPFSSEHTTGDGDADSVYFLPRTNGYESGHFHCFHAHCAERPQSEFLRSIEIYPESGKTTTGSFKPTVSLVCAADIKPEPVSWVWDGYIAQGKVHILAGPAGHGKTTVLLALGATITIAGRWPDGSRAEKGDIAIWSGEDDPADTLVPRLISCGADLRRVHFINGVIVDGEHRSFDPAIDMQLLREAIAGKKIKMLIIDPIVSAVGGDSHKNAETRRALQPVVDLAAELDCAVYGVTHFTKGTVGRDPVERVTGSLAFGALTRLVTVAMKLPDDGDHPSGARIFARAKSNIGPDGGGFYYFLQVGEVPGHEGMFNTKVLWGDSVEGTAKDLIAKAEMMGGDQGKTSDAIMWLQDILSDGPVAAGDVLKAAKKMGFTKSTLHRAKKKLGIKSSKVGFATGWGWFLPEEPTQDPVEGPIQLGAVSSGEKSTQVIDSIEDPTKVSHVQKMEGDGTFAGHEDPKGLGPSDGLFAGKGLGGVETTKIPCPTVLGPSDSAGTFDEDEVII